MDTVEGISKLVGMQFFQKDTDSELRHVAEQVSAREGFVIVMLKHRSRHK
jgi:hypothetical protein